MRNNTQEHMTFMKLSEGSPYADSSGSERRVFLSSFSNIAVQQFSFPFSGVSKVKEALRIHLRPLLGSAASDVSMVPFFIENGRKGSAGCVFLLFASLDDDESLVEKVSQSDKNTIWPSPLLFAAQVSGKGIAACTENGIISTVLLDDWVPKYYATSPADKSTVEQEIDAAESYARSQDIDLSGGVYSSDMDAMTASDIQRMGEDTVNMCPAYSDLDLSNRGMDLLEMREKLAARMLKLGRVLAVAGIVLLAVSGASLFRFSSLLESSGENAERVYFNAFGERSTQPLSSARAKLRSLSSPDDSELSISEMIKSISFAWGEAGASDDIIIENIRYGSENTDMLGTADSNDSIQLFRSKLEDGGLTPRVDNIQRIPNGSLRFNISLTRGAKQ